MKVVFLNLADRDQHGLAATSTAALRRKYPQRGLISSMIHGQNSVQLIDLFEVFDTEKHGFSGDLTRLVYGVIAHVRLLAEIQRVCRQADKVMIGMHGYMGDTDQGHAGMGWNAGHGPMGTYRDFAKVIRAVFTEGHSYRLSLIMCFGARAANAGLNHATGNLTADDIRSSFAFKFYREFCRELDVVMTARTGSVSFDEQTGRSVVQTEAAVEAEREEEEIQNEGGPLKTAYDLLLGRATSSVAEDAIMDRLLEHEANPSLPASSADDRVVKDWAAYRVRAARLFTQKHATAGKYGKYVYTYDRQTGHIVVRDKYGARTLFDAAP